MNAGGHDSGASQSRRAEAAADNGKHEPTAHAKTANHRLGKATRVYFSHTHARAMRASQRGRAASACRIWPFRRAAPPAESSARRPRARSRLVAVGVAVIVHLRREPALQLGQQRVQLSALRPAGVRVLVAGTVHAISDLECDDVLVGAVLPSQRVMPHVDLAIIAGGQGSVQCAMAAGTPAIVLPLQPEQDWNGQLLEKHGAGRRMTFKHAASPKLAALARHMLEQPSFRDNARRIARIYAKLDGPGLAAEAILEYAGEIRPVSSAVQTA